MGSDNSNTDTFMWTDLLKKSTLKKILVSIIFIAIIQTVTYYSLGTRLIHKECLMNFQILAFDVDSIGLFSPYISLTESEKKSIKKRLQNKYAYIDITESEEEYRSLYRLNEGRYGATYRMDQLRPFYAKVLEGNGTLYYGEVWEAEYIWIMFKWIKLRQENIGQS